MFQFGDLLFRPVEREDLKALHAWENDFELIMYSRGRPLNFMNMAQIEHQYEEWTKEEKELHFIIELANSKQVIGMARIEREIWSNVTTADVGTYIGKKELWGKGLGKQITVALLEMSFNQLNADRCEARSIEYNQSAHKVLETCGFKKGGAARQVSYVNGRKWDWFIFDILREEYMRKRTGLLKQTLRSKLGAYLKQHCTIKGY
jgi:RimJ/RimL family protein N-acetyltransferase